MNTKSNIQLIIEEQNIKNFFKQALSRLVESYNVEGNVFAIDHQRKPVELTNGYFVEEKTYDNLNDCVNEMKTNQAVSINEDKFILGNIRQTLNECEEGKKVMDIEYLKYIR